MNRKSNVFSLYTFAFFLSYFFRSANGVIATDLIRDLSLNSAQLGLMTGLFFAPFAAMQIPLGRVLDQWGPRRVTSVLMVFAALGSLIFGIAPSFNILALGRFLMGVGMAAVLMGGMKAFSVKYTVSGYVIATALMVGIGASGVLFASAPLARLSEAFGWRSVFIVGAGIIAMVSFSIWLLTDDESSMEEEIDNSHSVNMSQVLRDIRFWRIAFVNFSMAGGLLAFQGLWAGPYLVDVFGFTSIQTGDTLLFMAIGTTAGYFVSGVLGDRIGLGQVIRAAGLIFISCLVVLFIIPQQAYLKAIYFLFGLSGGFSILLLTQSRMIAPNRIMGQVISSMNLFGIGGAFILQWWFGVMLSLYKSDIGQLTLATYRPALLFLVSINALSWIGYLPNIKELKRKPSPN